MLISVVAIALVVSTGTDSALAGNFRSSEGAYYSSVAGLEEARGRLLWKNPDFINKGSALPTLFDVSGALPAWGLSNVVYIINPNLALGETVNPTGAIQAQYPDTEYNTEFPNILLSNATVYPFINSVSPVNPLSGPSYKWVRITPATEWSLQVDVNGDGTMDKAAVLYYDPAHVDASNNPAPSLVMSTIPGVPPTPTSVQVLEVTALAVLPNGSTRLLQYVVAPVVISPDQLDTNFPAALTLDDGLGGGAISLSPPSGYVINGADGCNPPPAPTSVASVGYTSVADQGYIQGQGGLSPSQYPGSPFSPPAFNPTKPSLLNTTASSPALVRQSWLTPASLDAAMQDIVNSADVVINGTADGASIWAAAPAMSASNPMTIVVNGNLTLNGGFGFGANGYGLLLVTGTLNMHPSASWNGIVLVVGQGTVVLAGHHGSGGIVGSMFVAQTRDAGGNLLPSLKASFTDQYGGSEAGAGIQYNSCAVKSAQGPLTYKVLSFHEILPTS